MTLMLDNVVTKDQLQTPTIDSVTDVGSLLAGVMGGVMAGELTKDRGGGGGGGGGGVHVNVNTEVNHPSTPFDTDYRNQPVTSKDISAREAFEHVPTDLYVQSTSHVPSTSLVSTLIYSLYSFLYLSCFSVFIIYYTI